MDRYVIWHNPKCSTSRFVLNALREAELDPEIRNYLSDPPSPAELQEALQSLHIGARQLLRQKNTPYHDLGLDDPSLSDDALIAAMAEHPVLIERPVVFSPKGAKLCRPKETVLDLI
ncbi:arsenate reductase (glutaredoxin) [Paracoccus onubensis]|uniref:arsenate reductase (glutaredoxin) n=1 Tax=Paracoccus onubensis TaxID=1675788 RepID=UPI00273103B8|nr:arsenate reductase (glutaredoxin) [Paracoccus onubensis]MDP0928777.1 arsenate reductase (glutaredoxin) [Paracoccus onubensis]